jgi:hypothetical protein
MPLDGVARSDLNFLLFRQQVERSRSTTAASEAARKVHNELAGLYERRIEQLTAGNVRFAMRDRTR